MGKIYHVEVIRDILDHLVRCGSEICVGTTLEMPNKMPVDKLGIKSQNFETLRAHE